MKILNFKKAVMTSF